MSELLDTGPMSQMLMTCFGPSFHIFLHIAIPLLVSVTLFRRHWLQSYLIMMLGLLIDLDHLTAQPVYAPDRCSIGFHPLHSLFVIPFYPLFLIFPVTRLLGVGLVIHIVLDLLDCVRM